MAVTAEQFIPPVGTRTGTPVVQGVNEVFFNLYLPSGAKPAAGWPVAIFGHGTGGSKQGGGPGGGDSLSVAASLAEQGIATIAINVVGHGFGPLSTLTVIPSIGAPETFPEGGRGIDQDGDGIIGSNEGIAAPAPRSIIADRDGRQQTVVDLMQLVRVIETGIDVNGDGSGDLDASRVYYVGQSLGGIYGTAFLAVEPDVQAGVLNVAGGSAIESARLSVLFRPSVGASLAARTPSLLNGPGVTHLDGVAVAGPGFDENMPLRDGVPLTVRLADGTERVIQSPVINTTPGAMQIQEVIEHTEWVSQAGNAVAYAPHIRKSPLAGIAAKSVIYQFAKGDQVVPNPANAAILRAGDLADRATFYRHDLAFAENPQLPTIPHGFLTRLDVPGFRAIARGAQEQIAVFLTSDGEEIIHPEPARFFEVPIDGPLPEGLNYILPPGPFEPAAPTLGSPAAGSIRADPAGGSPPLWAVAAAVQLDGTAVGPGAVIAAFRTSQLATALVAEGTAFGAGATFLAEHSLPENLLDPDPWRVKEPIRADRSSHWASRAPALIDMFDHVFADRDDTWLPHIFGDYRTGARVV